MSLHKAVRIRVLAAMFGAMGASSLEEKHFADLEKLLSSGKDGARIILPSKTAAILKNGELVFMSESDLDEENKKTEFLKRVPTCACNFGGMFATVLYRKGEENEDIAEAIENFSENAFFTVRAEITESAARTLRVRNRENGDKYAFGGMTRTLKKLLSGASDTAKKRRPVFCDESGIFWFPGFRLRDDIYSSEEKIYILHYFEYEI
jgi:hypothetical protein